MSLKVENYQNLSEGKNKAEQELLEMIHKIKSRREPPYKEDDPYYLRYPWTKLGAVSSGVCMAWGWYWDTVILEEATKDDLLAALTEYEAIVGNNECRDEQKYHPGDHVFSIERTCKVSESKNKWSDVIWPCILYCDVEPKECEYYISETIIGNQYTADRCNRSNTCYPTRNDAEAALEKYRTNL